VQAEEEVQATTESGAGWDGLILQQADEFCQIVIQINSKTRRGHLPDELISTPADAHTVTGALTAAPKSTAVKTKSAAQVTKRFAQTLSRTIVE
jgi:hypothetical protein